MGKSREFSPLSWGKVLLKGKFSLKKGKKIIHLIVGNQLLIFGEKVPKKKNFPFHFYQCIDEAREILYFTNLCALQTAGGGASSDHSHQVFSGSS